MVKYKCWLCRKSGKQSFLKLCLKHQPEKQQVSLAKHSKKCKNRRTHDSTLFNSISNQLWYKLIPFHTVLVLTLMYTFNRSHRKAKFSFRLQVNKKHLKYFVLSKASLHEKLNSKQYKY